MSSPNHLLQSIQASTDGLTLSELLTLYPELPRRTAQLLWISQLIDEGKLLAIGKGRARRYLVPMADKKTWYLPEPLRPPVFDQLSDCVGYSL